MICMRIEEVMLKALKILEKELTAKGFLSTCRLLPKDLETLLKSSERRQRT